MISSILNTADTAITFTVAMQGVNGSSGPNSDVTINTYSSNPVAMIVGGRERDIGIGSGMVELDGSASRDPDQPGTDHLEFTWRCVQVYNHNLAWTLKLLFIYQSKLI